MKQINLFGEEEEKKTESVYTSKIVTPIYEIKSQEKPHVLSLVDNTKTLRLITEIQNSNLPEEEKKFLILAAYRHTVFNYENIAEYYAHSSKEMQDFMERSALVILDFNKAYEFGYVQLANEIANQYFDTYGE